MEFKMVCATWIKEEDEIVLNILKESDRWMTAEELSEITGLSIGRVRRTLALLAQQMRMARGREKLLEEWKF